MNNIKLKLDKILGWFCVILFSLMVILTTYQVVVRYVFSKPSAYSETLARYLFVWLILYSSAYVFGQKDHINIGYLKEKMPESVKQKVNIAIELITIAFSILVLIYGGIKVSTLNMLQFDSILNIPTGYIYSCIPIAGILIIFYSIYNIALYAKGEEIVEDSAIID
ncbi:TRAP transporter small permease [Anaerococcus murdochii]|uniref:TRAP transporter small permease n=1 Tax=Anaerococcus murdochii TaxID=411577 RepID=A0ABS7SXC9_9FIRM|nr:TRAP transporter small permease [Anaerococcus murdochii]MBZ2386170.1 TRAP transporter small permease [Anaerococcus murdochii]